MPNNNAKLTSHEKGVRAEDRAVTYLKSKKYQILETRFKTRYGEIDIVAQDKKTLVFIEVKARKCESDALFAVTERAKSRITKAALQYMATHDLSLGQDMRFDVIAVIGNFKDNVKGNTDVGSLIKHLDNAFTASP